MAAIVAGEDQGVHPYPLTPKTTSSTSWSLKGPRPPGNYWQRFATIFRETFLGPPKPTTVPSGPTVTMETTKKVFGAGVEKTGATTSGGGTTAGRVLGRGFFAAGVAIGSAILVGGTAVGFTVDSGIGAVMMFPVGEGIFNGIKGLFG